MRKSIDYLPLAKQADLKRLVKIIREQVRDVVMIILFGDYARNSYVDYSPKIESAEPTHFMSDYNLLVVVDNEKENDADEEYDEDKIVTERIPNLFAAGKDSWRASTRPDIAVRGIKYLKSEWIKYDFALLDAKKNGVILYNSHKYKFGRPYKTDYIRLVESSLYHFEDFYQTANQSLLKIIDARIRGPYIPDASELNRIAKACLHIVNLFNEWYSDDSDLPWILARSKINTLDIYRPFPQDSEEEMRLINILNRADPDSDSPDKDSISLTQEDADTLIARIIMLRDIAKKVSRERIALYMANCPPVKKETEKKWEKLCDLMK